MTNKFELCPAMKLRIRRHYTTAPRPLVPCRARRPHHQSARSLQASLTLWTIYFLSCIRWAIRPPANGGWCTSHFPTALCSPPHACKGNSSWNSIHCTMPTFGSMQQTSNTGCNTMPLAKLPPYLPQQKCISFGLLIHLEPTLHAIA